MLKKYEEIFDKIKHFIKARNDHSDNQNDIRSKYNINSDIALSLD